MHQGQGLRFEAVWHNLLPGLISLCIHVPVSVESVPVMLSEVQFCFERSSIFLQQSTCASYRALARISEAGPC